MPTPLQSRKRANRYSSTNIEEAWPGIKQNRYPANSTHSRCVLSIYVDIPNAAQYQIKLVILMNPIMSCMIGHNTSVECQMAMVMDHFE